MNIELQEAFELADLKHKIRMKKKKEKNRRSRLAVAQQHEELSCTKHDTFDLASLSDFCRSDSSPTSINIVSSNDQAPQAHPRLFVDLLDDSIDFVDEIGDMENASIGLDQQIEENSESGSDPDSEESSQMQLQ